MGFASDLNGFRTLVAQRGKDVFAGSVAKVHTSLTEGSPLTGAPGQPVDTGNLVGSWTPAFKEALLAQIATNVEYAEAIEEGQQQPYTTANGKTVTPRPMQFRSKVGGPHSLKLTIAGWDRILESATAEAVND